MDPLQFTWFILYFVLFIGYAVLDGFDLGMGVISLFTRRQEDRDVLIRVIMPFWDGNEVWLLTAGGALYATFPTVYTILSSAFAIPFSVLLLALIVRAVSMELRHMRHSSVWQGTFDMGFGLGSLVTTFVLGLCLANVLRGLPIRNGGVYSGSFFSLLNPYSLLGGVLSLITFTLYGAAFGAIKTRGDLQNTLRQWVSRLWVVMIVLWICMTVYTLFEARFLFEGILKNAVFDGLFVLFLISILVITISSSAQKDLHSFFAGSVAITCMLGMAGACLFPRIIPSSLDLMNSLILTKDSAPSGTMKVMLLIPLIGMPLAVVCHLVVNRCVKGKTKASQEY
ncbi:MAG: cytochrome d ubiquinol oxidase subunit II [Phycisphaerae bacterium]|nr:cytochrome d ubiquinol oxidase subunit II [Phycisphaerae bacterium]